MQQKMARAKQVQKCFNSGLNKTSGVLENSNWTEFNKILIL